MSKRLDEIIVRHHPDARTLLEVACGAGGFLRHLKDKYRVEGLDLNVDVLNLAATHCPEVKLHTADMLDFAIPRRFDVIACLFSSIAALCTVERMWRSIARMAAHLNPDGILLIEPFFTPETCWNRDLRMNTFDSPERKIAWMYVTEVMDKLAISEIHYLVGEKTGVEHFTERHELGLFTDAEYREAMERVGMDVSYDPVGACGRGMYIGVAKPS